MPAERQLNCYRLGTTSYAETHELQKRLVAARIAGEIDDTLLLLEHSPVVTLGRSASEEHLLWSRSELAAQNFEIHEVGRGGDVTYHGPGQLVGYPIINLKPDRRDVRKYVWTLEETMLRIAADYGIEASRIAGLNGTWVEDRKLGAVGVRISRWVTMHGFAINVNTELDHFSAIVPCGIPNKSVTSLSNELGRKVELHEVSKRAAHHFAELYAAEIRWQDALPIS